MRRRFAWKTPRGGPGVSDSNGWTERRDCKNPQDWAETPTQSQETRPKGVALMTKPKAGREMFQSCRIGGATKPMIATSIPSATTMRKHMATRPQKGRYRTLVDEGLDVDRPSHRPTLR